MDNRHVTTKSDLAKAAEQFDALYTDLTALQRELISAVRGDAEDGPATRELVERARAVVAAARAADRALELGRPSDQDLEVEALRARVLVPPLDVHLLLAAFRSQGRSRAFPLIAEAIEIAEEQDAVAEAFADLPIAEVLAAPRGMGTRTAARLASCWGFDPAAVVSELSSEDRGRLRAGVADAAYGLPDGVETWRRSSKPSLDGREGGSAVLKAWVEAIGPPSETARVAAAEAAAREGWPKDAVPAAEHLVAFTREILAPGLFPDWEQISAGADEDERLRALRAQSSQWRRGGERDGFVLAYALNLLIEAITATRKARRLVDGPESEWGSSTPLALARTASRRCGDLVESCEPGTVAPLLTELPGGRRDGV